MEKFKQPFDIVGNETINDVMPAYKDIPHEFKSGDTKWNRAVSDWFFVGINKSQFTAKKGIDADKAFKHIGAFLRSWEPKHEHKEAAAAYLMSLWFKDVKLKK